MNTGAHTSLSDVRGGAARRLVALPVAVAAAAIAAAPSELMDVKLHELFEGMTRTVSSVQPRLFVTVNSEVREFIRRMPALLAEEPVEDGITHSAEPFAERLWRYSSLDYSGAMLQFLSASNSGAGALPDLLRLYGRTMPAELEVLAKEVVSTALRSSRPAIREEAVRIAERMSPALALHVLAGHVDELRWMNRYILQVHATMQRQVGPSVALFC